MNDPNRRPAHAVFWVPGMVAPPRGPKTHPDSARERLLGTVPDPIMAAASKPFDPVMVPAKTRRRR